MRNSFEIEEYFNFKTFTGPGFDCLYVSYWRKDLNNANGFSPQLCKFLAQKVTNWLSNEFCRMCELNSIESSTGVALSWVITKEKTFLFRQPNSKFLEIGIIKEKVSDSGNIIDFLQSKRLEVLLKELSGKAMLAFSHQNGVYNRNNTLKY
jgi:hypothetical protein